MLNLIKKFYNDESGATMVEYGLIVALIAVAVAVAVFLLGEKLDQIFDRVVTCVSSPDSSNCAPVGN